MLQPYLLIHLLGSVWEKLYLHLTSTHLLELLAGDYLHETNISIFIISLMFTCSIDTLKKSSKKKETTIKKEIVEVLQQPSYRKKRTEN